MSNFNLDKSKDEDDEETFFHEKKFKVDITGEQAK